MEYLGGGGLTPYRGIKRRNHEPDSIDEVVECLKYGLVGWGNKGLIERWLNVDLEIIAEGYISGYRDPVCVVMRHAPEIDDSVFPNIQIDRPGDIHEENEPMLVGIVQFGEEPEKRARPALVGFQGLEHAARLRANTGYIAFDVVQERLPAAVDRKANQRIVRVMASTLRHYPDREMVEGAAQVVDHIRDSEAEVIFEALAKTGYDEASLATLRVVIERCGPGLWQVGCEAIPEFFDFRKVLVGPLDLTVRAKHLPFRPSRLSRHVRGR